MKRRQLLLAAGALAIARLTRAQTGRVRRIGILLPGAYGAEMVAPFTKRLADLGWVQGQNLAIEVRDAEAHQERLPALAAEGEALIRYGTREPITRMRRVYRPKGATGRLRLLRTCARARSRRRGHDAG